MPANGIDEWPGLSGLHSGIPLLEMCSGVVSRHCIVLCDHHHMLTSNHHCKIFNYGQLSVKISNKFNLRKYGNLLYSGSKDNTIGSLIISGFTFLPSSLSPSHCIAVSLCLCVSSLPS